MALTDVMPLVLRFPPGLMMSPDEFFEFSAANRDVKMELTSRGEVVIVPAAFESSRAGLRIGAQVLAWADVHGGEALGADMGFTLPNGAVRSPDAAWVAPHRVAGLTADERRRFLRFAPDFVAEVRSAFDRLAAQQDKMQEYMEQGTQLGLLLDPETRNVYVYRPGREMEVLHDPESVPADPVLPGLKLILRKVW
ncbi:MAG: Uma2 family endonuclease [Acidobacteria bacterium]|nr:Uma2 family endonuclease [Acidobacteriota bacterium]